MSLENVGSLPINTKIELILSDFHAHLVTLEYRGILSRELWLRGHIAEELYLDINERRVDASSAISDWLKNFDFIKKLSHPDQWASFIEAYRRAGHATLAEMLEKRLHPDDVQPDLFKRRVRRALDRYKKDLMALDFTGSFGYELYLRGRFDGYYHWQAIAQSETLRPERVHEEFEIVLNQRFFNRLCEDGSPQKWHDLLVALRRSGNETMADVLEAEQRR